ncbi:PLP-dependent transferase, partial [Macroventuria anomochaeta]
LVPSFQTAYDFSPVKKHIKAVLLSNPSNPLGRCYPRSVLTDCLEFCQERGLHLICDELYALTDFGRTNKGEEFVSVLSLTEPFMPEGEIKVDQNRVHVIWSASRLLGVSGLRVAC